MTDIRSDQDGNAIYLWCHCKADHGLKIFIDGSNTVDVCHVSDTHKISFWAKLKIIYNFWFGGEICDYVFTDDQMLELSEKLRKAFGSNRVIPTIPSESR